MYGSTFVLGFHPRLHKSMQFSFLLTKKWFMIHAVMKHKHKQPYEVLSRSKLRHLVTVWGFLVLAAVSAIITLTAYIGNSAQAKKKYDTLLAVDKAGGNVEQSLFELRSFIYAHMNTTIGSPTGVRPPIQLKGTYDRLVQAEKARAAGAKEANANLYTTAQKECEKQIPDGLSGRGRIPCITDYVTTHSQPETEQNIPEALYQYDFVSPSWSPDVAGYGILVTSVLTFVFLYQLLLYMRLRHRIHAAS